MKKTDLRLSELIARCLLGIATEQERGRLQAWLDDDPGHREE